jgi:hypothetical protein
MATHRVAALSKGTEPRLAQWFGRFRLQDPVDALAEQEAFEAAVRAIEETDDPRARALLLRHCPGHPYRHDGSFAKEWGCTRQNVHLLHRKALRALCRRLVLAGFGAEGKPSRRGRRIFRW